MLSSSSSVLRPVSATLRSVCLKAHLIDSMMRVKLPCEASSAAEGRVCHAAMGGPRACVPARGEYLVGEQRREAVVVDGAQQIEEVGAVFGEVLEVLGDHVERALEDGLEDPRHLRRHQRLQGKQVRLDVFGAER